MRPRTITYSRLFPVRQYENIRLEAMAEVNPAENLQVAYQDLQDQVDAAGFQAVEQCREQHLQQAAQNVGASDCGMPRR